MYIESELLPLSGLQHLAYCARQWALIHLEQVWTENRLTVEGRHLHERADKPGGKSRRDLRIVRGMPIHSLRLGLSGRADVIEFHRVAEMEAPDVLDDGHNGLHVASDSEPDGQSPPPQTLQDTSRRGFGSNLPEQIRVSGRGGLWRPLPVEYKRGKPKAGNCDRVQLCAQALCVEEMLAVSIPAGALFYGRTRRREEVIFDSAIRTETQRLAERMQELFRAGVTPRVRYSRKLCDRCSLYESCLPKTTGVSPSVNAYLSTASVESENTP